MQIFADPERLWLLVALLPMAAWVILGSRRRLRDWTALGQSARPPGDGSWGWLVAMALLMVALAQPRWGRVLGQDPPEGHDVVLLVDTSRSMAAEDAVPDRLGVAIESGSSLLKALQAGIGARSAVVAFAGRGVTRCPLTSNLDAAIDVLQSLRAGDVQPGGTDLGAALEVAIGAFDDEDHAEGRSIVVFSDGEDHVGSWASTLERLRGDGIIVHSVAIGDLERGHPVPSGLGGIRNKEPAVETRRSDVALEALAKGTGGAVIPLGLASADLGALFRDKIEPTARQRRDDLRVPERVERFPVFVLAALGVGLTTSWPGLARRRGRRLAFSILAVAMLSIGAGPSAESASGLVERGRSAYESGRFAEALDAFDRAIELNPTAAIPRYNAASALFQLRRFPQAIARYEEARERGDAGLSMKIDYAIGNAHLVLGHLPEAIARYDECMAATSSGPVFDAVRLDAAANREFAERRLKPPAEEPEPAGADPSNSNSKRSVSSQKSSKGENGENEPDSGSSQSTGPPGEKPEGSDSPSSGKRGAGGAGGGGKPPPPSDSPDARLDAALKEIREARRQRPPEPPPSTSKGVGKDW